VSHGLHRVARVVAFSVASGRTYEVMTDLTQPALSSMRHVPDVQPPFVSAGTHTHTHTHHIMHRAALHRGTA
jgi:hypothetical protein